MTKLKKLDAGLTYDFWDEGVNGHKLRAIALCAKLNVIPMTDEAARASVIRELFAEAGENTSVLTGFNCDYGLHIRVGNQFLANYNVASSTSCPSPSATM